MLKLNDKAGEHCDDLPSTSSSTTQVCGIYYVTSVSVNSGGYLPRRFAARQISTTIHLHLNEQLLIVIKGSGIVCII